MKSLVLALVTAISAAAACASSPPVVASDATTGETAVSDTYVCPMDPDVKSPTPGTCPKCGMKLVLKK